MITSPLGTDCCRIGSPQAAVPVTQLAPTWHSPYYAMRIPALKCWDCFGACWLTVPLANEALQDGL